METEVGARPQVVGLVAPVGELVTEQVRDTVPVKVLDGVTVMVAVLPLVAPGFTLRLPLLEPQTFTASPALPSAELLRIGNGVNPRLRLNLKNLKNFCAQLHPSHDQTLGKSF